MNSVYFREVTVKTKGGVEYTVSKDAYDAITSATNPIFRDGVRITREDAQYEYEQYEWTLALSVAALLLKANTQDPYSEVTSGVNIIQDAFSMEKHKAYCLIEEALEEQSQPIDSASHTQSNHESN